MPEIDKKELSYLKTVESLARKLVEDPLWGVRAPSAQTADELLEIILPGEANRRAEAMSQLMRHVKKISPNRDK
jgi:hypothetical protein